LNKSKFNKNGIDDTGTHWLQYISLVFSAFAVYTTWAYFFDFRFHNFILNVLRFIDCSGFNSASSYCMKYLRM
tara:strand:- start:14029 stop:14247 length:219 start_codon:yes stop_codon:yes gene_type:complete